MLLMQGASAPGPAFFFSFFFWCLMLLTGPSCPDTEAPSHATR